MSENRIIVAREVMHDRFIEMDGLSTIKEAIHAMRERDVDVVMVKKRNEHDAHGMVLLVDIAKKVLAVDRAPERVNVYEIMSKPVVSVAPEMNIRYCARLFERFGLSVAPVIEHERVLGIVSYRELVLHGLFKGFVA